MTEKAKLTGPLPLAFDNSLAIADDGAAQSENKRECMFGHRVDGIAAHVRDDDTPFSTCGMIDDVVARRSDRDHLQIWQLGKVAFPDWHFVGDGNARTCQPLDHPFWCRRAVLHPFVREARPH